MAPPVVPNNVPHQIMSPRTLFGPPVPNNVPRPNNVPPRKKVAECFRSFRNPKKRFKHTLHRKVVFWTVKQNFKKLVTGGIRPTCDQPKNGCGMLQEHQKHVSNTHYTEKSSSGLLNKILKSWSQVGFGPTTCKRTRLGV